MDYYTFKTECLPVLAQLWPKALPQTTDEQRQAWARCAGNASPAEVNAAIRAMYDDAPRWPEPGALKKKLRSMSGTKAATPGYSGYSADREREEWDRLQHSIREVIDSMSDDDLDAHALMYAASHPHLHWTANMHPRVNVGVRAAIHYRVRAGLGPYDKQGVFKQADGRPGFVAIADEAIDHVRELIRLHGRRQKREGVVIR